MRILIPLFVALFIVLISACHPTNAYRETTPHALRAARQTNTGTVSVTSETTPGIEKTPVKGTIDIAIEGQLNIWELPIVDSLIDFARKHLGTPYKWAGTTPGGFDCSGFVYYVFHHFNIMIPRMPTDIAKGRERLSLDELQPGDFAYFKGRNLNSDRIGHIALVTEKTENGFRMIHASTSQGIIENNYDDFTYWKARFLFGTRMNKAELMHE